MKDRAEDEAGLEASKARDHIPEYYASLLITAGHTGSG